MSRRRLLAVLAWGLALVLGGAWGMVSADSLPVAPTSHILLISPAGPYTSLTAALAAAQPGDTLQVQGGVYPGPLVVDKAVRLVGLDWPLIQNPDTGTVVTLTAPGTYFGGFVLRGSGNEPDRDHAGVAVTAPDIIVENNRLDDVLFGVFVAEADGVIVRGNDITSKAQYDLGRKGDGIRLWYSHNVTVENNHVHGARDVVMWYANGAIVRGNTIDGGRYGLHLMYCDDAVISGNRLTNNSVGVYTMYSNRVQLRDNLIRGQRGPSGYALGFKDSDDLTVIGNVLVDNGAGAFLDGAPFSPQGFGRFEHNIFAYNDAGVVLLPAVRGNDFETNVFWENIEQVAVQGGGTVGANVWLGNYWSDYTGFDANGDGVGETPYFSARAFENLSDREPRLRMLLYSPTTQAIEMAAYAFPVLRPQPKVEDAAPRLTLLPLPVWAAPDPAPNLNLRSAPLLGLALAGLGLAAWLVWPWRRAARSSAALSDNPMIASSEPVITIRNLSKRFGRTPVLHAINLTARPGQAIALWGQNGAGKTTLLKALLGLVRFEGDIHIAGHDVRRAGKEARRQIGYVPQEIVFYDWSVATTLAFYARLKRLSSAQAADRIAALTQQLGLAEHSHKAVSALSGGLKQRLALAIALLSDPPILLLDEPTANLDAQGRRDYLNLLAGLRRAGKTILFATHRLEELESLADVVALLEQGRLTDIISPEELRRRLSPQVDLTLWVPEPQRRPAVAWLENQGLPAHLNGRGTIVVTVPTQAKVQLLHALAAEGLSVLDFETD